MNLSCWCHPTDYPDGLNGDESSRNIRLQEDNHNTSQNQSKTQSDHHKKNGYSMNYDGTTLPNTANDNQENGFFGVLSESELSVNSNVNNGFINLDEYETSEIQNRNENSAVNAQYSANNLQNNEVEQESSDEQLSKPGWGKSTGRLKKEVAKNVKGGKHGSISTDNLIKRNITSSIKSVNQTVSKLFNKDVEGAPEEVKKELRGFKFKKAVAKNITDNISIAACEEHAKKTILDLITEKDKNKELYKEVEIDNKKIKEFKYPQLEKTNALVSLNIVKYSKLFAGQGIDGCGIEVNEIVGGIDESIEIIKKDLKNSYNKTEEEVKKYEEKFRLVANNFEDYFLGKKKKDGERKLPGRFKRAAKKKDTGLEIEE